VDDRVGDCLHTVRLCKAVAVTISESLHQFEYWYSTKHGNVRGYHHGYRRAPSPWAQTVEFSSDGPEEGGHNVPAHDSIWRCRDRGLGINDYSLDPD
jgi:hypothetical protein